MELFYDLDEFINDMIEQTLMNNVLRNSMETYNEELFTKDENLKMNAVVKKMPENQSDCKCYICYEDIKDNSDIYDIPCGHFFHKTCLDNAVCFQHVKCPVCRHELPHTKDNNTREHQISWDENL